MAVIPLSNQLVRRTLPRRIVEEQERVAVLGVKLLHQVNTRFLRSNSHAR